MKKKRIVVSSLLLVFITLIIGATTYIVKEYNYRIDEEERIEGARKKVQEANVSRDNSDIEEAKELINKVDTTEVKDELSLSITSLELDIRKESIKNEYSLLLDFVEKSLNQQELNNVIAKINLIEYEDIKKELLERTVNVQELIDKEKKRLEQLSYYNKMKKIDATPVISTPPANVAVLERLTGKITAFTPYCSDGCRGYTASGKFVGNGDIYQYDSEYGMVRIVAGDSSYPFGTIVRIKNLNYFGEDIYAMVLDRGGAIGKNRRALFDLLFATLENANKFGVAYNVECEILRLGY